VIVQRTSCTVLVEDNLHSTLYDCRDSYSKCDLQPHTIRSAYTTCKLLLLGEGAGWDPSTQAHDVGSSTSVARPKFAGDDLYRVRLIDTSVANTCVKAMIGA
jgi:hypothetical protein